MRPRIRVLVVEDSLTVRRHLCDILAADAEIEVVGEAGDGKRAIELCSALRPHVVTMDMMLPVMTGLGATEYIMAYCPTPILIVSSSTNRGELFKTYEALAAGAIDALEKPRGDDGDAVWERKFIATVKMVSRIRVITHPRARLATFAQSEGARVERSGASVASRHEVIAIGGSTGAPGAVVEILRALPASMTMPILMVLHIAGAFAAAFAEWLDAQTEHRVAYATDGDVVRARPGHVILAPPDSHMIVNAGRVRLTRDGERHSCRPSVDVLFESVAREYGAAAVGCLLTGMGRDGAAGLLAIRRAGGFTIAQDEATSVVFGMPREAIQLDAADAILPLGEIGPALAGCGGPAKESARR